MAAPASKTIHDLNGKWQMNKTLSDPFEPVLALQGVGFLVRKGINAASITLHTRQFEAPPVASTLDEIPADVATTPVSHVDIDQVITGGLKGTSEKRCLDGRRRGHSDWLFGSVVGQTKWIKGPGAVKAAVAEYKDEFLGQGFDEADADDVIVSYVVNQDKSGGWVAVQVWGFQTINGERRHVRNIVVTKGKERVAVRLVYDYIGELDA